MLPQNPILTTTTVITITKVKVIVIISLWEHGSISERFIPALQVHVVAY